MQLFFFFCAHHLLHLRFAPEETLASHRREFRRALHLPNCLSIQALGLSSSFDHPNFWPTTLIFKVIFQVLAHGFYALLSLPYLFSDAVQPSFNRVPFELRPHFGCLDPLFLQLCGDLLQCVLFSFLRGTSGPSTSTVLKSFIQTIPWNLANLVIMELLYINASPIWCECYCRESANLAWMKKWWEGGILRKVIVCLRNVQDQSGGNTLRERLFGESSKGPVIPFCSMVEYHPISAKDQSRLNQFGQKVSPG